MIDMDAEEIIQRIAQQKGVDAVTILNSLLDSLSSEHVMNAAAVDKSPTVLERLVELMRVQQQTVSAEQGKDRFDAKTLQKVRRENEAVYLVLQELLNAAEHYATKTQVKVSEERRRKGH